MAVISLAEQVESLRTLREFGLEEFQGSGCSMTESCGQFEFPLPTGTLGIVWSGEHGSIFFPAANLIGSIVLRDGVWQLIPVSDEELRMQLRAELAH